ncbi:SRPBCC family protein [Actinophytocola sp.]|uniref:SRPBCC family protein n=1 Tax=Actinophytocola sp. TaxID=1872138 RepID=UPI003D6A3544
MSRAFVATQVIDRPPETVWRVLTDWRRVPDWMPGVDEVTDVDDTTLRYLARKRERTSEITAVRPGESVTLTSVRGGVRADYVYSLEPAGGTTRATLVADVTTAALWRLVAPALRAAIRRADGGQLDALKRLVEAEP